MHFKGSPGFEEFWSLLENESPRGVVIVVGAYFDEKLGAILNRKRGDFSSRIDLGNTCRILTQNEHHDLHEIRKLRNAFAHNLRASTFDPEKTQQVNDLKTWQIAVHGLPQYAELFADAKSRLLYVAGCIYVRINQRSVPVTNSLPEPPLHDTNSWPIVTG